MPVTIHSAAHTAKTWGVATDAASSPEELFENSCWNEYRQCSRIIQSSMERISRTNVFPSSNGFVRAAYAAYSGHHHLTIRPDDVWFAILTQLSFYINAHAEELRSFFVSHEVQKEINVVDFATINSADFGKLAIWMTRAMQEHFLDPELREWIMPVFGTTDRTDIVTAAIIMMGSMQKYFSCTLSLLCGIPSVTLLGDRNDWVEIRRRLEFLPRLGEEPERFASLLSPVLDYFVRSFDEPTSPFVLSFWNRIADRLGFSGPYYLSGWITAFCFWSVDGKCLYRPPQEPALTHEFDEDISGCNLDGVLFHRVDMKDIPDAFASVPVKVDDSDNDTIYETRMVAGLLGIEVSSSGELSRSLEDEGSTTTAINTSLDSIRPFSGWWMYEVTDKDDDK